MSKAMHLEAADLHEMAAKSHRVAAEHDDEKGATTAAKRASEAQAYSTAAYEASEKALAKSTSILPTK